jgi:large subunit ribosomal protein L4
MNKKARKAAIRSALSLFYKGNKITVVNNFDLESIGTKSFVAVLDKFELNKTLLVIDSESRNLVLSARNIKNVKVLYADSLNIFDMMKYQSIMITQDAVKKVEGALTV